MRWLAVHCPILPLEVFPLREPAGAGIAPPAGSEPSPGLPRVVIEDNRVMLADSAAAAAGIQPGSTLATAHAICPALRHYRREPAQEARWLRRLAEALQAFSSQVSLVPPAGVVVEIGASLRLFGGAAALVAAVRAACLALGHQAVCRTATTPLAALALARAASGDLEPARMECPEPPEAPTAALTRVPLAAAAIEPDRLTPAIIEQLAGMGVHTLGQLLVLPSEGLASRFGSELVDYLARLTGARPDPRQALVPAPYFRRNLHLLEPVRSRDVLLGLMTRLLNGLQHWLLARNLGVEELAWRFTAAGRARPPLVVGVRFSTAQQRQARLLEISRLELDRTQLPDEVIGIGLSAERLQPWRGDSTTLFRWLPGTAQPTELGRLVDRLEARLGRGTCWGIPARDQHTPQAARQSGAPLRAVSTAKPGPTARSGPRPPRATGSAPRPGRRPIWLFVPPRPIRSSQLTLLRGPERIETGWWQPDTAARTDPPEVAQTTALPQARWRDYYVARLVNGAECWVFVDTHARWYLHGYFG